MTSALAIRGERLTSLVGRVVPYRVRAIGAHFTSSFEPGAFTASLAEESRVPLLLWHDDRMLPLGVAEAWQDGQRGLLGRFRLATSDTAQEAAQAARDGLLLGLSVGAQLLDMQWTYAAEWDPSRGPDHMDHVTVRRARLVEVSLTPTPAFPSAQVLEVAGEALAATVRPNLRAAIFARQQAAALTWLDANAMPAPVGRAMPSLGTTTAAWKAWLDSLQPPAR